MSDDDDLGFFDDGKGSSSEEEEESSAEETSESEEGSDEDDDAFEDGYGSDLIGDEEDRARLFRMTELERERILYERQEKRKALEERRQALQKKKKQKKKGRKQPKRAAASKKGGKKKKEEAEKKKQKKKLKKGGKKAKGDADEDEDEEEGQEKRSTRSQTEAAREAGKKRKERSKEDALRDLMARKEKRITTTRTEEYDAAEGDLELEEAEAEAGRKRKRQRRDDDADFVVDEDDSARRLSRRSSTGFAPMEDDELLTPAERKLRSLRAVRGEQETPLNLRDVIAIQLRRAALEKIIEEPYFEEYVSGKFVRVNVGQRGDGTPAYRLCEVMRVEPFKTKYKFGRRPDYQRGLLLKHGKAERIFSMNLISNHSVTQSEFDRWKAECEKHGIEVPSAEEALERKRVAEYKRTTFVYTEDTVQELLEKKRRQPDAFKHMNIALERARLQSLLDTAREARDEEKVKEYGKQLDNLQDYIEKVRVRQTSKNKAANAVVAINTKNKEATMREIDKMSKLAKEQALAARGAERQPDLFQRRPTQPALSWTADEEPAPTEGDGAAKAEAKQPEQQQPPAGEGKEQKQQQQAAVPAEKKSAALPASASSSSLASAKSSGSSSSAAASVPMEDEEEEEGRKKAAAAEEEEEEEEDEKKVTAVYRSALFPGVTLPPTPSDRLRERLQRQNAAFALEREDYDPEADKAAAPPKKKPLPPSRGTAQPEGTTRISLQDYVARLEEDG